MTLQIDATTRRRYSDNSKELQADSLARDLLAGAISVRGAEAALVRAQAALLAYLAEDRGYRRLAFASIADLAEELLQLRPRTTKERLSLHRILVRSPAVEEAFLSGRLTLCQILALAPVFKSAPEVATWIAEAESLTVREIRRRVRREIIARKDEPSEETTDAPTGRTLSFTAPPEFQVAWGEMIDLTRSVLGYEAPQHRCLEAILMETGFAGGGTVVDRENPGDNTPEPAPPTRRPTSVPYDADAAAEARRTLAELQELLSDLTDLIESCTPRSAFEALDHLMQTVRLLHPIRIFLGRVLRDLRRTRSIDRLGFPDLRSFVEERLRLSERTARSRIAESSLFEDRPLVEAAYGRGEIGTVKAHLIHRMQPGHRLPAWIARAREVTVRQFEREVRLLWLLRRCDRRAVRGFRGPFPLPGLEATLVEALCNGRGWTRKRLNRAMRERSLSPPAPGDCEDPAENRALLDRLEFLVDRLILSTWDTPPSMSHELPGDLRQMSARLDRRERVSVWMPDETRADLDAAFSVMRHRSGIAVPVWVVLTVLFAEATNSRPKESTTRSVGTKNWPEPEPKEPM